METDLTLMIQTTISYKNLDQYNRKRDMMIKKLEKEGWCVNVEDEGENQFDQEEE